MSYLRVCLSLFDKDFVPIQEIELASLCDRYQVPTGSRIMKSRFLELSADAIFNIAQDELRNGNIECSLGIPRCAQVSAPTSQRIKV